MAPRRKKPKNDYIKDEIKRINKMLDALSPTVLEIAKDLISNAAFMAVSLRELQDIINAEGYTEEYRNGANQFGVKKKSEVEIYNTMIKNFNATMKQLFDIIPPDALDRGAGDPLLDYIGGGM